MTEILGAKSGSSNTHTAVEYPDTISSKSICRMLIALGEGEMEPIPAADVPKHVYLDGTVARNEDGTDNFSDLVVEYRPGTPDQEPINGFPAVENETSIGIALKKSNAWVRSITTTDIDAVRLRLSFQLLTYEDNGDRTGAKVDYKIEYRKIGDSAYVTAGDYSINEKQSSAVERDHRIDLPQSSTGWQIRVTRLTDDSTSDSLINVSKIVAFTTILDSRLRYPWTALLFVQFDAAQFQNIPKVSMKLKGRRVKVPSNYDPETRAYAGTWDGTFKVAYTKNPAWVVYDIALQKRFGLGRRIPAQFMDKWTMYRISQRCDDMVSDGDGGMEPRHQCDVYIQKRQQAWTVIRDLVSIYNGMVSYGNQMLQMSLDQPAAVVRKTITSGSIIGKFNYSHGSRKDRRGICHVSYDNPDNHYASVVEPVAISDLVERYGIEPLELSAIGCIRRSEAQRRARWAILTNNLDTTVSFKVGLEGLDFLIGDVVAVSDEKLAGGVFGGRIISTAGSVVNIDQPLDSNAVVGDKFIAIQSGKNDATTFTIKAISEDRESVTLSTSASFDENTVFVLDCEAIAAQYFRITNIKYTESENNFTVTGLLYSGAKYDSIDNGTRLDERPVSLIPTGAVSAPDSVSITGYSSVSQGKRIASVEISWPQVQGAQAYNIQYRRYSSTDNAGSAWINVQQQATIGVTLNNVFTGKYQARVAAVGQGGAVSPWTESSVVAVDGKRGTIPTVSGLTFKALTYGILWSWATGSADTEDMQATHLQYRVVTGQQVGEWYDLANVTYPGKTYNQMGLSMGQRIDVRARYITSYGDYGEWSSVVSGNASDTVADYYEELDKAIQDGETYKELTGDIKEVANNTSIVASDLKAEAATRAAADQTEASERQKAITAEATARANAVTAEATARQKGDADEATARAAAIKVAADKSAADIKAESDARNKAITAESTARAAAIQKAASDAASALLNEKNERVADISSTQTVVQDNYNSLAQQIAQVSAGTGEQFDSKQIWFFDDSNEGWSEDDAGSIPMTVTEDGWLTAQNATATCRSPNGLSIDANAYAFIKLRIKKTGNPTWKGRLYWVGASESGWTDSRSVSIPEPDFDASGIATITLHDILWRSSSVIRRFRLDLLSNQTDSNHVMIDWVAVGRPTPGAGMAALDDERTARVNGDTAEATERQTLAVQMRGDYTGTDAAQVKTGLIYSEQQARIAADKVEVTARQALEAKVDSSDAAIQKSLDAVSTKTTANSTDITNLKASVANKAEASALNAVTARVTTAEGKITSQGTAITSLQNSLKTTDDKTSANATAIGNLDSRVTTAEGKITSQAADIVTLGSEITTVSRQGMNYWLDGSFESYAVGDTNAALSSSGRMVVVDSQSRAGSRSLKLSRVDGEVGNSDKTFGARLPIRSGAAIRIELWAMMPADQAPADGWRVNVGIWAQTPTGGNSWSAAFAVSEGSLGARDSWVKFTGVANLGSTAATGILWISMPGSKGYDIYIDDVIAYDITDAKAAQDSANAASTAIDALKTTVNQQGDTITAQGQRITSLDNSLSVVKADVATKATAKSVTDLTSRVTTAEGKVTSQGQAITTLQGGLSDTNAAVAKKADASALSALTNTVTAQGKDITSQGASITALNNSVSKAQTTADAAGTAAGKAQSTADANGSAINTLKNDVKTVGDTTSSNSTDITALKNSVNSILDAKENMVNNYDFRNGLDQWGVNAAPTPTWSATDGEGNTPAVTISKTGTSNPELWVNKQIYWPAPANARIAINVRGKGISGAMNLMCRLYIKSNDGTTKTIDRVMTFDDGVWSTQSYTYPATGGNAAAIAMRIYGYPAISSVVISSVTMFDVTDALTGEANSSAISTLQSTVTQNGKDITSQGSAITTLQGTVSQNTKDIATKADGTALTNLTNRVTTAEGEVSSQGDAITKLTNGLASTDKAVATKAEASALSALQGTVTQQGKDITSQGTSITNLQNGLKSANDEIATKATSASVNSLTNRVTSAEGKIESQGSSITSITADLATANRKGDNQWMDPTLESYSDGQAIQSFGVGALVTTAFSNTGSKSLRVYRTAGVSNNQDRYIGDALSVRGGAKYYVEAWVYMPTSESPSTGWSTIIGIHSQTPSGANGWHAAISVKESTIIRDTWTKVTGYATISAGATVGNVWVSCQGASGSGTPGYNIYIDDLTLQDVTEAAAAQDSNSATASALNSLTGRVTSAEGKIESQGSSITSLTNSVNQKAESTAVNSLTNRVTTAEGKITTQGQAITDLTTKVAGKADSTAVNNLTSRVTTAEGKITSQGDAITSLTAKVNDKADSSAVTNLTSRVTAAEGNITAQGKQITNLNTSMGTKADSSAVSALSSKVTAQGETITAQGTAVTQLTSRVGSAESSLNSMFESVATAALAQNNGFTAHRAAISDNVAQISQVSTTMATENEAMAQRIDTVSAAVGTMSATVQETATTAADANGKVSAMWGMKVQTDSDGVKHVGGIQLGVDTEGASQFLIDADTFAVYNKDASGKRVLAFANDGGTSFLRTAMIKDASIDAAKIKAASIGTGQITDYLQSDDYVANSKGMRIGFKSGVFEMNGTGGGGRMQITNDRIISYNEDGSVAAVFGRKL